MTAWCCYFVCLLDILGACWAMWSLYYVSPQMTCSSEEFSVGHWITCIIMQMFRQSTNQNHYLFWVVTSLPVSRGSLQPEEIAEIQAIAWNVVFTFNVGFSRPGHVRKIVYMHSLNYVSEYSSEAWSLHWRRGLESFLWCENVIKELLQGALVKLKGLL